MQDWTTYAGGLLWFTGLSGSGKSTLAAVLKDRLAPVRTVEVLDGDDMRRRLSPELGFSRADRETNVRRIGLAARQLARHGVLVITATISPYADTRTEMRRLTIADGLPFVEVFLTAPMQALIDRDVKGLYKRAFAGEIEHFTGVSDPYEAPTAPELVVHTDIESVDASAFRIMEKLREHGLIPIRLLPPVDSD